MDDFENLEFYQWKPLLFSESLKSYNLTEGDFQNWPTNNAVSTLSEKYYIMSDKNWKRIFVEVAWNKQHAKPLADKIHELFIPTIALCYWETPEDTTMPIRILLWRIKWMVQRRNTRFFLYPNSYSHSLHGTTILRVNE